MEGAGREVRARRTRSCYRLFVHLAWHTKRSSRVLTPAARREMQRFMSDTCGELQATLLACDGADDHLHAVVSYPPQLAVTQLAQHLKGAASHHVNQHTSLGRVVWQDGYGAFSVSERDLPRVIAYVRSQEQHHADGQPTRASARVGTEG